VGFQEERLESTGRLAVWTSNRRLPTPCLDALARCTPGRQKAFTRHATDYLLRSLAGNGFSIDEVELDDYVRVADAEDIHGPQDMKYHCDGGLVTLGSVRFWL
jgi:hypothetical protein